MICYAVFEFHGIVTQLLHMCVLCSVEDILPMITNKLKDKLHV